MSEPRIKLKDPWIAAALAWVYPGLGHAYQGRWFKAGLFCLCISTIYFGGWWLGDGRVVYFNWNSKRGHLTIGYFAQLPVGPSIFALLQDRRAHPGGRDVEREAIRLRDPVTAQFRGYMQSYWPEHGDTVMLRIEGEMQLDAEGEAGENGSFEVGKFTGTASPVNGDKIIPAGTRIDLVVERITSLQPEIYPSPNRELQCDVRGTLEAAGTQAFTARVQGELVNVRSFWNRFEAPLDLVGLQQTHGELGKFFDIGGVYTWIAGLLNLLVILDALHGPAYGYGDEEETEEKPTSTANTTAPPEPQPASSPATPETTAGKDLPAAPPKPG